jgi:hypothetical protein
MLPNVPGINSESKFHLTNLTIEASFTFLEHSHQIFGVLKAFLSLIFFLV